MKTVHIKRETCPVFVNLCITLYDIDENSWLSIFDYVCLVVVIVVHYYPGLQKFDDDDIPRFPHADVTQQRLRQCNYRVYTETYAQTYTHVDIGVRIYTHIT